MASRFAAVTNKEISQIIKQAVPEISEGLFEFTNETCEKLFCLQMQIKLKSCITLFSWIVHK